MLGKFIDHKEDSLTAAVFTHLLHLPSEVFWRILRDACYTDTLPVNAGEPRSDVDYWPKWNPAGTGNAVYVEPDVFIRFDSFDLIVEAKRWDDKMQDRDQWRRELIAYANEYGEEKKDVRLLAVGGIHDENDAELTHQWTAAASPDSDAEPGAAPFTCPVHKCRWRGILDCCRRMLREWEQLSCPSSQTRAVVRVLTDLIDLFAWHGFSTGRWFADFDFARHRLSGGLSSHQNLFRQRSQQLTSL
jgi:hypothetical protein